MTRRRGLVELLTPWGAALDPDHPLPEYPRPQLARDSYLNINGRWEYAITRSEGPPARPDGRIVVPFPPEAPLSGVRRVLQPDEVLHYRRTVRLPAGFRGAGDRLLLHLGAVDQWCRVHVNGRVVGEHDGGYLPIDLDVTAAVPGDDLEIRVTVRDPTDTGPGARGKQRLRRGGIWYTPQSGIWQTVWLEAVPTVSVARLDVVPDLAAGAVDVRVHLQGAGPAPGCEAVLRADGVEVSRAAGAAGAWLRLLVPDPRPWSPADPYLYGLDVRAGADRVASYAGLRCFGIGRDRAGRMRLLLNGRPHVQVGVLDQGYWPDGLCTAPSDAALVHDIATMKRLGFTMLRKHVKVEPLRWYHHCDRLGMLVWQDVVNGGGAYRLDVVGLPAVLPLRRRDHRYRAFGRTDPVGRQGFLDDVDGTVALLRNVVSLAVWVPFNEGWGQFGAAAVAARVRGLDPTRLVDHASGWYDQRAGDLDSRHVYVRPVRVPRRGPTAGRALVLSEYGGYSWRVPGHSVSDREFGYRRFRDAAALARAFARLHQRQVGPAVDRGLAATVYTQLSDVEEETNGLLTYDRRVQKIPDAVVRAATDRLRRPDRPP